MQPTVLTLQQLKEFNGQAGKPAYIAVKGKIYDVTHSDLWERGDHQGMHEAGMDLTAELENAPHGDDVLSRFPLVGELGK